MPIFEAGRDRLQPLAATRFGAEGWREREDLQRLLARDITCLDDGLMVLAEEFSSWADSMRRIDLLCLDPDANLVVVELKRDEEGGHMELQALRYAAMVSGMTFDQAVETLAAHRNKGDPDKVSAQAEILSFLHWSAPDEDRFARNTRILLAAADFGRELTTTVLWLRERGVDIRCVRLRPYRLEEGRLLLDIHPLIPLPEAADFQTRLGRKRAAEQQEQSATERLRQSFWTAFLDVARALDAPLAHRNPVDGVWLGGATGRAGVTFYFGTRALECQAGFWFAPHVPGLPAVFEALKARKEELERVIRAPLFFSDEEGAHGRALRLRIPGGCRSPETEWPVIHRLLAEHGKALWDEVFARELKG